MSIKKQKRQYRKITPRVIAQHQAQELLSGNATQAVRDIEPDREGQDSAIQQRAHRIVSKRNSVTAVQFIDEQLEQIGSEAIERVGAMVHSEDERIATKNAHYVIDHLRGKAVQRSISLTGRLNIQNVLD